MASTENPGICLHCGTRLGRPDKPCPGCGAKAGEDSVFRWLIWVALVAVVLFIAIGVFLYRRPRHVNPPLVQRITVSWPCTFTAQQQNTLIHLSDSQQRDTYLSEMMSLTQQGLSFNLDRGDQVEVMEKSGKAVLVRPISGTHNNATPCYVDQDVVDAPGPAKR